MHKLNRIQSVPRGLRRPVHRKVEKVYSDVYKHQEDVRKYPDVHACCCIGPQNGEPVCPCRMKNVLIVDGRYKEIVDLGEVISKKV